MILTEKLETKIVPKNISHLKEYYPNIKIGDTIEIDIIHLSEKSPIEIICECEICGIKRKLQYRKYIRNRNRYNYYSCKKCKNIKTSITKKERYGDENYNNSAQMIKTKEKSGIYLPRESISDFQMYRKLVNRFTYKSKKKLYTEWTGYDYYDNEYIKDNFNLLSKDMSYPTIDHIISIHFGFVNNIPPYIIGDIDNICVTKRKINLLKSNK